MGEEKSGPGAGAGAGSPDRKIVYAVVAIAVAILAVVLIAKFGFSTDLLNPEGGQMSLVQHPGVTVPTPRFQPTTIPRLCPLGLSGCSGRCVNLVTDNANCGSCGNTCPSGKTCSAGTCTLVCSPGQTICGGTCVDLKTDAGNCGSCGKSCASSAGSLCSGGTCYYPASDITCVGVICTDPTTACCSGRCVHVADFSTSTCNTINCPPKQVNCKGKCIDWGSACQ